MDTELDININKLIIALIQSEKFLYDKQDPDYVRKNDKKDEVYEVISQAVFMCFQKNIPAKTIEERWEMLLVKYKAEKRKMNAKPASGSGAALKLKKWEYYDNFSFMDNCLAHRQVNSSMQTPALKSKIKATKQNLQSPSTSVSQASFPSITNKVIPQHLEQPSTSFSKSTLASQSKKG